MSCSDAEWLVDELGGDVWSAACGSVPGTASTITKLAWLRRTEPAAFARIAKVLTPHDWITFRLSRRYVTDRGDASATGYWSPRENRWRPDLLSVIDPAKDWGACLPEVLGPTEPAGDREGVVIAPGTGRNQATALGLGLRPHDVVVSLDGTAGTTCAVRERPTEDPTGAVGGYADATGRFLPLARSFGGLRVVEALAAQLGIDMTRLDQLALAFAAGRGRACASCRSATRESRVGRRPPAGTLTGLHDGIVQEHIARSARRGRRVRAARRARPPARGRRPRRRPALRAGLRGALATRSSACSRISRSGRSTCPRPPTSPTPARSVRACRPRPSCTSSTRRELRGRVGTAARAGHRARVRRRRRRDPRRVHGAPRRLTAQPRLAGG